MWCACGVRCHVSLRKWKDAMEFSSRRGFVGEDEEKRERRRRREGGVTCACEDFSER